MITGSWRLAVWVCVVLTAMATPALAQKRVALVIGISAYDKAARLANPVNDAKAVAAAFVRMGFDDVVLKLDLNQNSLRRALGKFARAADGADVAVLYYAGHGLEVAGKNYLIPVDAVLANAGDVDFEAVSLATAMGALDRAGKFKLVILDACRDNPFRAAMAGGSSKRAIGRGLARVSPAGSDTLVAYAAREGTTADDGSGNHSPYTKALLSVLETPGLDVRLLFGRVRDAVRKSTGNRQEPFTYGSLGGHAIYLSPPASTVAAPGQGSIDREALFWSSVKDARSASVLETYLQRYPGGHFAALARARIKDLSKPAAVRLTTAQQAVPVPDDIAARLYEQGKAAYLRKDYRLAVRHLRKAAALGHVPAINSLGFMYMNGLGVRLSHVEALRLFRKAAGQGLGRAYHNLGAMYARGLGVARDVEKASEYIFMALQKRDSFSIREMTTNAGAWNYQFRVALQRRLKRAGYYNGQANGSFDSGTLRAIRAVGQGAQ